MNYTQIPTALILICISCVQSLFAERIDLAGHWQFQLDPEDTGIEQAWYNKDLSNNIRLPGSLQEAGFGEKNTFKDPARLSPTHRYTGAAWYQKTVTIPENWDGKQILLFLERCHWESQVWVNGRKLGTQNSLCVAHEYNITPAVRIGKNRISIRIDNTMNIDVGKVAHSVSYETQTNWNGIVGRIELRSRNNFFIDRVEIYPDISEKHAGIKIWFADKTHDYAGIWAKIRVQAASRNTAKVHETTAQTFTFLVHRPYSEIRLDMGDDMLLWDEFDPALYELRIDFQMHSRGNEYNEIYTTTFGLRDFKINGTQFMINNRPVFLRGTLECCIFPKTGYATMEKVEWRRIINTAKSYGLNHFRFHSWCPPEAAFQAADELGFYFQVETPVWTILGEYDDVDQFVYDEGDRILAAYGNHPSFTMLAAGNEPAGPDRERFLGQILEYWKRRDSRRVYTGCSGWPDIPEDMYQVKIQPRLSTVDGGIMNQQAPNTDVDFSSFVKTFDVPIVSHEIGQWCVYPNFSEMKKYTGVCKPLNFEIFKSSLAQKGMLHLADDFLLASGKLQAMLYKQEIEAALRTPGFGGFQLLQLHDFPGQGSALVGILDPFWESKRYITAKEHRRYCNATVPLCRMKKRILTTAETFYGTIQIPHFGRAAIDDAVITWKVEDVDGRIRVQHSLPAQNIEPGNTKMYGEVKFPLKDFKAPQKYRLTIEIDQTEYINSWEIWIYPSKLEIPRSNTIHITSSLEKTMQKLNTGNNVLFLPKPDQIAGDLPMSFTSFFWNTQWFVNQKIKTLGMLCDPKHPVFAHFPTEFHTDWQWWDLFNMDRARCMNLDQLPKDFFPMVQPIDDWVTNRKLGLLLEARVGRGKLIVCSMDLETDLKERPVARQMLFSILEYMKSDDFKPKADIELKSIFKQEGE